MTDFNPIHRAWGIYTSRTDRDKQLKKSELARKLYGEDSGVNGTTKLQQHLGGRNKNCSSAEIIGVCKALRVQPNELFKL